MERSILNDVRKRPTSTTGIAAEWADPRPGRQISPERLDQLLTSAKEMEELDPWSADAVRYAGRCFIQANLPHSIQTIDQYATFTRSNGKFYLEVKPDSQLGIPYGTLPRLILIWVADEVRRTRSPEIHLGESMASFMAALGLLPTGGRWGSIPRLRNQLLRLFNADIRFRTTTSEGSQGKLFSVQQYSVWWDRPTDPNQRNLWESKVLLSEPLFEELLVHSAPIDMRAITALRKSPMELDVYCWLSYRMLTLRRPLFLDYETLRLQFGAHYKTLRDFKVNIDRALWTVLKQYPAARVEAGYVGARKASGWKLSPSPTHVPRGRTRLTIE